MKTNPNTAATITLTKHNRERHKLLARALVQALKMWGNDRYRDFLHCPEPGDITEKWFDWFVGNWRVARTIRKGCLPLVRAYLNTEFRAKLQRDNPAATVDEAADFIQEQGWSSCSGNGEEHSRPISLVSKVGFFLRPTKVVPLDRYSLNGLNALRKDQRETKITTGSYQTYLEVFEEHYNAAESELRALLTVSWCADLANAIGCPETALQSVALRRKLFDNFLMHRGDYEHAS